MKCRMFGDSDLQEGQEYFVDRMGTCLELHRRQQDHDSSFVETSDIRV